MANSVVLVTLLTPGSIQSSGTYDVSVAAAGSINVTGSGSSPIDVVLSSVAAVGLATTYNIVNANVRLNGAASVALLTTYNIGNNSTLEVNTGVGLPVGTAVNFTGTTGHLVVDGLSIPVLGSISGFGPGKTIDIAAIALDHVSYTDNAGPNTGGTLTLYGTNNTQLGTVALNTGDFVTSNFGMIPDGGNGTLLQFDSFVTGLTATPGTATLGPNATVAFTVSISNPITVTGTPTLTLDDGGIATYDATHSTSTQLKFNYTVGTGQNSTDLNVTGIALNGATLATIGGGGVQLSTFASNPSGTLVVDTIAPTVTAPTVSTPDASLKAGGTVLFNVAVSEPITVVGGTPTLTLTDGGIAYLDSSSTPTKMVFRYTVASGENSSDLGIAAVNPNGATIADLAGNAINLAGIVGNPVGTLVVDTIAPTVTAPTVSTPDASLKAGGTVLFNVAVSEPITVVGGTPTLTLTDGGIAYLDSSSTPTKMVFRYTVASGENSSDLGIAAVNPNGATIADLAGNAINLAGIVGNPVGTLVVDTIAPTVTAPTVSTPDASLKAGGTVLFNVAVSEPITVVGGTPTLTLTDGGIAYLDSSSTPTKMVFRYTVASGENSSDLGIAAVNPNGATIADLAGNAINLAGIVGNPVGTLVVDTIAPTVTAPTVSTPDASLKAGGTVLFNVAVSEPITVVGGTPTLTLTDGGIAYLDSSSTPTKMVFRYTVASGENSSDLGIAAVNPNGATIADLAGNAINLAGIVGNPVGTLVVDTIAPTVTAPTVSTPDASLKAGGTVLFNVAVSEPITVVGGTPTLTLTDGGIAYLDSSSTPTKMVFRYTVASGENSSDLGIAAVNPNGATIADLAGNAINLAGIVGNPVGTLVVDTIAPTVTAPTVSTPDASLKAGGTVLFNVAVSEPITVVGGTPTLTLTDGGIAYLDSSSTPTKMVFRYTVASGENSSDLGIAAVNPNGATIADLAGNAINLAGIVGNPVGTLVVDTIAPTVTAPTVSTPDASLKAGGTVLFNVAVSEPITVVGGTPTLTLTDGGIAYLDSSSTPTKMVFRYTVASGENSSDLGIAAVNPNGATIADLAGNAINLAGIVGNPVGTLVVDTIAPTITSVTASSGNAVPGTGDLAAGQIVTFNIAISEAMLLASGNPTLSLNDNGTATFDPANSTSTNLVFHHTIVSGENSSNLAVTGVAGTGLTDLAGNPLNLAAANNVPTGLVVDTRAPTVTSVTTLPGNGALKAGQTVTFNVALSEAVAFAAGTRPTLTLNDGGTAIYDNVNSTATNLAFTYVVQPNRNVADLAVTAANLGTAAINDLAGNALDFTAAAVNPDGTLTIDTITPTINSVTTNPTSGALAVGQTLTFSVAVSEAVFLTGGVPTLTLSDGGTAIYDAAHSTPTNLVFTHTVQAGQNTSALTVTSVNPNGAIIADPAGNPLTLPAATAFSPTGVITVDSTFPAVASVATISTLSDLTPSSDLTVGGIVTFTLGLTANVTLSGSAPSLTLNDGGIATFVRNASTPNSLVFTYTVTTGMNSADLAVTTFNLNTGTIVDSGGRVLNLDGALLNPPGILVVDTLAPTITSVTTNSATGSVGTGQTVTLTVTTSEAVKLLSGSTPTLTLSDNGVATYDPTHSDATHLGFTYTVAPNDTATNLAVTALTGAGVTDLAGNALDLTGLTTPTGLVVDTLAPTITSVTTNSPTGSVGTGQTVTLTVTTSEAVKLLSGSTPTLTLSDNGVATYDPTHSDATHLGFTYTVAPNDTATNLAVTALTGAGVTDLAGNALDLTGLTTPTGLVVDTLAPTITSVTTNSPTGSVGTGQTVTLTVTTSEAVKLLSGSTPTLTLSDNGVATYDPTHSDATHLGFTYTVAPNDTATNLAVTALTGAGVTDLAGNALDLTGLTTPTGLVVDTLAPTITSVTTNSATGSVGTGQTVTLTVTTSEAVKLLSGSTPTLTLSDNGVATYDPTHSDATHLGFTYTVAPNDTATNLAVTALTGAGVTDLAGNALDLTGLTTPTGLVVDTLAPTITSVTTNSATGSVGTGQTVTLTVTTSEAVKLLSGSTPTLTLSDNGVATYDPTHSDATHLGFTYTVAPNDTATNLAVTALTGAGVTDLAGNALDLTGLTTPTGLVVDTLAPTITSVTTNSATGSVGTGQTVTLTVTTSEAVKLLSGSTPTLTLSDNGVATYDPTHSDATHLGFTYTVAPNDTATNLAVTALTGAGVTDLAGNALDLTGLTTPTGLVVDTLAPTITSVTTNSATGSVGTGQTVTLTVTTSEAVKLLSGSTPTLTLSDNGVATYDPTHSDATHLGFTYTVAPNDTATNLAVTALTGAGVTDLAGNALDLTGLTTPTGLVVDTLAPTITSVTTDPATGSVGTGQTVTLTVTTSEAVKLLSGSTPTLTLSDNGVATYDPTHSDATHLGFTYTVAPNDTATNLAVTALTGAGVTDLAGNALDLTGLTTPTGLVVDTLAPTITSVTTDPATGSVGTGQTVTLTVTTSEAVKLLSGSTPTLILSDNGVATYDPTHSDATHLGFTYTVAPNDTATNLAVTALTGAGVTDLAGNALDLTGLTTPTGLVVDTLAPTITSVTTDPATGSVGTGQTVAFNVTLSEAVMLAGGTPTLTLSDGGIATYNGARSTRTNLVFTHTIQPGQNASDLAITSATIAGAVIADGAGNRLDLSGAVGNPAGVLVVSTTVTPPSGITPPTVLTVTTTPDTGSIGPGQTVSFTITTDSPVFVAGGVPTLALSDGGLATYNAANSTPTHLVFDSVIQPGQLSNDLAIVGYDLHGGTITDAAGSPLSLAAEVNPPGQLVVTNGTTTTIPDTPIQPVTTTPTPTVSTTLVPNDSVPNTLSVYRFFDSRNGTHFYTTSDAERDSILSSRPDLVPEGQNGVGLRAVNPASGDPAAVEVFRFFDTVHGTQFLTASKGERDDLIANRPDLKFEPQGSFFEHSQPQPNDTAVYRFFSSTDGTHFYTDSASERANILQTRPDLIAEGIGFYEPH